MGASVFNQLFRAMQMVISGKVIQRIDTVYAGGYCTVSLRLKQNKKSGEQYVVLACISQGNYEYFPLELDEFRHFADAVNTMSASIKSGVAAA